MNDTILVLYSKYTIYAPVNSNELFAGFTALESITFDNFNTSNVTSMFNMFIACWSLTRLDLSNFYIGDNIQVTDMLRLNPFAGEVALTELITPYYVGTDIDISTLGLSSNGVEQTTISAGSSNLILTKAA